MKVLFLDIDGVLCTTNYWVTHNSIMKKLGMDLRSAKAQISYRDEYGHIFCPTAVKNLSWIIEATGAKIVISSTWRMAGLNTLQTMWEARDLPGEVLDITGWFNTPRGEEIADWLKNNQVDEYLILDDDSDMLPEQSACFIKTDPFYGLTNKDSVQAVSILNKE